MARIIIVWGLWGPYHCRRFEMFRDYAAREGHQVTGVSLFTGSSVNQWRADQLPAGVIHFKLGADETRFPFRNLAGLLGIPGKTKPDVALLPSYDHWSLALNVAVRVTGARVVMMNDSHEGTARARGLKAAFKQRVVAGFHAGFVAGAPHMRYFASLGLPRHKLFTGYDAVDNDFFARRAEEIRGQRSEVRGQYELPENYFLSLGRFVPKKNLTTLIRAYRKILDSNQNSRSHLVLVGSGEEEPKLHSLCRELRLPVYDKVEAGRQKPESGKWQAASRAESPGVHFYGFRQIEENPVFYALADAFILPSLWEEWGLVVNEAMASGLPVVVSETAGCAEDLLKRGCVIVPTHLSADLGGRLSRLTGRVRQNGFLFNPNSVESLTDALMLLEGVPSIRQQMSKASCKLVSHFSCENFSKNALLAAQAALQTKSVRREVACAVPAETDSR